MQPAQYSATQVLRAFEKDAPALFLGSAFITVALVSAGYCLLRRRFERLLVWMAIFAALYGLRLWLKSHMLDIEANASEVFRRIRTAIDFLVPIPCLIFFQVAGFGRKDSRTRTSIFVWLFAGLTVAALALGPQRWMYTVNAIVVSIFLWIVLVISMRRTSDTRDFFAVRIGVLSFVVLALADNTLGEFLPIRIEPFGFAVLLVSLGYMAARRTLERDVELGEIQKELELARKIQLSILPKAFPSSSVFQVAAIYVPMTSVAGDFYDFFAVGERQAGLLVADVGGHGVPAALIASMVKMAATAQRANAAHPERMLTELNAALCGNSQGEFVTAACVYLDGGLGTLTYGAAGHPAMLLLRDGEVSEVAENGLPLGALASAPYAERTLALKRGDRLMLYTDGLVEARNPVGELFGDDRLKMALASTAGLSADEAAGRIAGAAEAWAKLQEDDLTVLVCDVTG